VARPADGVRLPLAPLLLLAVAAAGCASGPAVTVHLRDNFFDPDELVLHGATQVRFQNDGAVLHQVTVHDPDIKVALEQDLAPGQSVDFVFGRAGPYHVVCKYHASVMELSVTVQ
jgi:plastocyanin